MAKREEFDFDSFEADNFGYDDGFGEGGKVRDDRSPVSQAAGGFMSGVKSTATSGSFMKSLVLNSLPNGYKNLADTADIVISEGSGLYNETLTQARPVVKELKRVTRSVTGLLDPVLPKSISDKLKDILADKDTPNAQQQQVDADEAALSQVMAGVFQQQAAAEEKRQAGEVLKDITETKRHKAEISQLDDIRQNILRLATYQDTIGIQWQRKMLELTYRNYFANRDQLAVTKAYAQESVTLLRTITKNTALPEAVKIQNDELASLMLREKLIGKAQSMIGDSAREVVSGMSKNLSMMIRDKISTFADNVSNAAMGLDQMQMVADMAEMSGQSGAEMGGEMAGSVVTNSLATKIGQWIRKNFTEKDDRILYGAEKANDLATNFGAYVKQWGKSATDYSNPFSSIIEILKQSVPGSGGQQAIGYDSMANSAMPAVFSNHAHQSLTEIIPGYLARILQSSEGIRTGSSDVPLTVFDKEKNAFISTKQLAQSIYKKAITDSDMSMIQLRTSSMVDKIDPDKKLDETTRKALQQELVYRSKDEDMFDPKNYLQTHKYSSLVSTEQAAQIAEAVRAAFDLDDEGEEKTKYNIKTARLGNDLRSSFKDLKRSLPEINELVSSHANTGNRGVLRQMGLLKERFGKEYLDDGYILRKYQDYLNGTTDNEQKMLGKFTDDQGSLPTRAYAELKTPAGFNIFSNNTKQVQQTERPQPKIEIDAINNDQMSYQIDRVIEAMALHSTKDQLSGASATLLKLMESVIRIEQMLPDLAGSSGGAGGGDFVGPRRSIYDRIGAGGEKVAGWGWNGLKGIWNGSGKALGFGWDGAKKGFKFGKDFVTGAWDKANLNFMEDVYVKGAFKLDGKKLRAGLYFDAEGNVIKSFKDIKGAVYDDQKQQVLSDEEYQSGLFTARGKRIKQNVATWLGDKTASVAGWMSKQAVAGLKMPGWLFKKGKEINDKYFNKPFDVYIPGETKPRLTAIGFKNGDYISSKTLKPLKTVRDIDSDIVDKFGNVLLSTEDYSAGIVDVNGKPIKTVSEKLKTLAETGKDWGIAAAKWVGRQAVGGLSDLKKLFKGGVGLLSGVNPFTGFGSDRANVALQTESLNVLKMIYNLLKNHFQVEGDDLVMTEMPAEKQSALGKAKSWWKSRADVGPKQPIWQRIKNRGKKAKDTVLENEKVSSLKEKWDGSEGALAEMRKKYEATMADIQSAIDQLNSGDDDDLNDGKDTVLARWGKKARKAGRTIRELVKEKNGEERTGSWMETLRERKRKRDEAKASGKEIKPGKDEKGDGILMKILMAALTIGSTLKGVWSSVKEFVTGLGSIKSLLGTVLAGKGAADAAGGVADALGGVDVDGPDKDKPKGGAAKPKGRLARMGSAAWRGTKALGRGAMTVGGGAVGVVGTVARVGWFLGAGVMSLLASPAVLTAGAVTLAGYGAYKAYRYFKDKLEPIQKVRMAQYGIPAENKEDYLKVAEFELALKSHLKFSGNAPVEIDDKVDYQHWMEFFGVHMDSADQRIAWASWYGKRFKPVFLSHWTHLNKVAPGVQLESIDSDLDDSLKAAYVRATRHSDGYDGPYGVSSGPFGYKLELGTDTIDAYIAEVVSKYGHLAGKVDDLAVTTGVIAGKNIAVPLINGSRSQELGKSVNGMGREYSTNSKVTGVPLLMMQSNLKAGFGVGGSRMIDDLAAIRVASYGLVGLDVGRVNTLLALEQDVIADLVFMGPKARFEGDPTKYYATYGAAFGGGDTEHQAMWMFWFKARFLPALLNYATAIRRIDSSVKIGEAFSVLSPAARLEVGRAIVSTETDMGGRSISIWSVDVSPFAGRAPNLDQSSVKSHLQSLENAVGKNDYNAIPKLKLSSEITVTKPAPYKDAYGGAAARTPGSFAATPFANVIHQNTSGNPALESLQGTGGLYNEVPKTTGKGYAAVKDTLNKAAEIVGIDPSLLATIARIESTFNPNAKAPTSSASGLFQFLRSTWRDMMDKYGDKYGIPKNAAPTDGAAAALLGAQFIKDNQTTLEKKLGRSVNATDVYMAHFMGAGGSSKMLKANPNDVGATIFPKEASSNRPIFYKKDGSPRTVGEIYKLFDDKVSKGIGAVSQADVGKASTEKEVKGNASESGGGGASAPKTNATGSLVDSVVVRQAATTESMVTLKSSSPAQKSTTQGAKAATPKPVPEKRVSKLDSIINDPITNIAADQKRAVEEARVVKQRERVVKDRAREMTAVTDILNASYEVQLKSANHLESMVQMMQVMSKPSAPRANAPLPPPVQPINVSRSK
jgi:hypothetical protein